MSPYVRGNLLHSCLYFSVYYGTYTVKILIYIPITEPYYFQPILFQYFGSDCIFFPTFRIIMSSAIQFDHQSGTKTVKIRYIVIDAFLTLEPDWVILQKTIP